MKAHKPGWRSVKKRSTFRRRASKITAYRHEGDPRINRRAIAGTTNSVGEYLMRLMMTTTHHRQDDKQRLRSTPKNLRPQRQT